MYVKQSRRHVLGNCSDKYEVLSSVIESLESKDTFQNIVEVILQKANTYIQAEYMAVIQENSDKDILDYIATVGKTCALIERVENGEYSLEELEKSAGKGTYPDAGGRIIPIKINGIKAMYVVISGIKDKAMEELDGFIHSIVSVIQNTAQMRVTNNSLLSSYEVLKDILNNIGSGIIVCDRNSAAILFSNKVAAESKEIQNAIKECIQELMSSEEYKSYLDRKKAYDEEDGTDYVKPYIRPIEKYSAESGLWFEIRFTNLVWIDGSEVIVCTASDITQKKKSQQKIEFQAHNDFLTGLYNRMKCESDLKKIIKQSIKDGVKGALMFIDLDDFKHINDGLGHQYGDVLLQQIAAGLQSIVGLRGKCYRMGGDEFVAIVMPDMFSELERIANKVKDMFNKPWYLMETEYFCTMSMGIAVFPDDSKDVHEIIRLADIAMYESKKNGKNGYTFYDSCSKLNTVRRLDIENSMRQAVTSGIEEFVVFYQPVVDVRTGECSSCEALVRWDSKALGFMGPGDFIPLAEYLGLITSIGDYVLEEACRQCRYWNEHGIPDFHINVNLSVVQLLQKDVAETVARILKKTGVNPKNIVLEITESFAINDMDRVLDIIKGIKKLGPRIALDDFGTGYSSLNYIKQLPLDIIKVDKTFIDDIVEDEYAQAFIKLIVELSDTIDTDIIVEGVENEAQLNILKELGVDYIQGFYYGKPVPAYEFEKLNFRGRIGYENADKEW
ncbi:MAG: bifunctional diguanylate cyclase/phosphodiesterase [Eubacterium sp.]|nr:bifunctional diguanylate cyclase/phosphodiesterase [Eubacterium sp.]